ncbi:Minor extracellular protease vpr [Mycena venus]|uniref:Minor extracellular protease vpr n=1 Tax=Mycena venus TaxID=2733690 RepID=A0A8H6Y0R8_9AGAR|nr:Minor extracellular protease vpr [Mycena venus]
MKVALSLALLGATSAFAAKASLSSIERVTNLPFQSNKFIVEVSEESEIPSKRALGTPHEQLYRTLRERNISFNVHKEYDVPGIFIGASLTLNNTQDVTNILNTDGVIAIRPVRIFSRPVPILSKPISPNDSGLPDSESTHIVTGVDKLHAKGITGKGIKIGILDTGTDYTHPFLGTLPLYVISNDTTVVDDACNPLPASTPDLSPFVVLVRRGTCTFVTKLANIAAFGATTALIYDNGNGFSGIEVGDFNAALIQAEDGVFLAEQYAAGASILITFPQTSGSVEFPAPTGGLVSAFTTYGPTNDFYFKPAITAPGGSILSTFPIPLGTWALLSGTSMATPHLAGSSALFLEVKGKSASVARSARTFFQATAKPISSSHTDGDPFQTVTQQGAGLINVYDAIFGTTLLSKTELILNDTAHFAGPQKFTVKNAGRTVKTYTLSHVPAGTAITIPNGVFPDVGPVALSTDYASVSFNGAKFTLLPGQSHEVVATIKPPQGVDATTFPVYSGFIHVTSGNDSVHATYLGLAASLKDTHVIDNTDLVFGVVLPVVLDSEGNIQDAPVNYTFVGGDAPTVLWRQAFGTPLFRLDLVSPDIVLNGTLNARAPISFANPHKGGSFAKVPILGALLEVPYLGRSDLGDLLDNQVLLSNTFANGTIIPNGSYKILLRSLRVTGDPTNEADYESWLSPIIGVAA